MQNAPETQIRPDRAVAGRPCKQRRSSRGHAEALLPGAALFCAIAGAMLFPATSRAMTPPRAVPTPINRQPADPSRVLFDEDGKVTLAGSWPSRKLLLENLCEAAGIRLRAFGAEDRPHRAAYRGLPLRKVIERVLKGDSYVMGTSRKPASPAYEIRWLWVLGQNYDQKSSAPAPPAATGALRPVTQKSADNAAVISRLLTTFGQSPDNVTALLSFEDTEIAEALIKLPVAQRILSRLRTQQRDPQVRRKLEGVYRELRKLQRASN